MDDEVVDDLDDDDEGDTRSRTSVTTGVPRNTAGRQARRNTNQITRADLQKMQTFGLDPNSPTDRKAWLDRNKSLT